MCIYIYIQEKIKKCKINKLNFIYIYQKHPYIYIIIKLFILLNFNNKNQKLINLKRS